MNLSTKTVEHHADVKCVQTWRVKTNYPWMSVGRCSRWITTNPQKILKNLSSAARAWGSMLPDTCYSGWNHHQSFQPGFNQSQRLTGVLTLIHSKSAEAQIFGCYSALMDQKIICVDPNCWVNKSVKHMQLIVKDSTAALITNISLSLWKYSIKQTWGSLKEELEELLLEFLTRKHLVTCSVT